MTFALVAHTSVVGSSGGATTPAIDTTGANLIAVVLGPYATPPAAPTDNKGNSYTLAVSDAGNYALNYIYYSAAPTVGAGHTFSTNGVDGPICVLAFSGAAASPLDQTNHADSAQTLALQPGSVTPGAAGELIIAATTNSFDTINSIDSGFTITDNIAYSSGVTMGAAAAYLVQTSAAPVNPMWSYGPNNYHCSACIATFKAAASTVTNITGSPFPAEQNEVIYNGIAALLNPVITNVTANSKWLYPVTGTIPLDITLNVPAGSVSLVYQIDGVDKSPVITGPDFAWNLDTTMLSDGTHYVSVRVVDTTTACPLPAYFLFSGGLDIVVHNTAFLSGAQSVPSHPRSTIVTRFYPSRIPEMVHFPGVSALPLHTTGKSPYPYQFVAGSNAVALATGGTAPFYVEATAEPFNNEYEHDAVFATTALGGVGVVPVWEQHGGLGIEEAYPAVLGMPKFDGVRGDNRLSPYSTFVAAPDGNGWLFVELNGRVGRLANDGSVTTIAGQVWNRNALVLDPWDTSLTEAQIAAQFQQVGTIGTPSFGDFRGGNDICYDPRNHAILYVAKTLDHCIIKIDTSVNPPVATRYAGQDGVAGFADGAAISALFNEPYSIIMSDGTGSAGPIGTMYVADKFNNRIRAISPDGSTVSTVVGYQPSGAYPSDATVTAAFLANINGNVYCPAGSVPFASAYIPYPQCIRFFSDGHICLLENVTLEAMDIDLAGQTVKRIGSVYYNDPPTTGYPAQNWAWLAVDRKGMVGPVDDILIQTVVTAGMRISRDNTRRVTLYTDEEIVWQLSEGGSGGPNSYPWAVAISETEGRFLMNGIAGGPPAVHRIRQAGEPNWTDPNYVTWYPSGTYSGSWIWQMGTCVCFPWDSRPSFQSLMGHSGAWHLGDAATHTFDSLNAAYPTDAALATYIQSGLGGGTPRPEITGNDLRDLIYYIRRRSQAGSYPTPVQPGATNPDTTPPVISNVVATRLSSTSIQVTWSTDKSTIGLAAAGSPAQAAQSVKYNTWSPIETGFGTSHSVVITGLPSGVTPIHFTVLSKDMAGNSSYVTDQTVA